MNIQYFIFATTILSPFVAGANVQSIEVVNNSNQPLHITANGNAQSLNLRYSVPAYAQSLIISQLTLLRSPQEVLFDAILSDNVVGIRQAIRMGADAKQSINGKSPMLWAVVLQRFNAIRCLLEYGAAS
jgi:hypothetical protein